MSLLEQTKVYLLRTKYKRARRSPFTGVNFLTPTFLGALRFDNGLEVEVCHGEFMRKQLIGITCTDEQFNGVVHTIQELDERIQQCANRKPS